jgi:T5SS/PEP-CTERM-associated repeat protein
VLVGFGGQGTLVIGAGGEVVSGAGVVGYSPGSSGEVLVGNDGRWSIGADLDIALGGRGRLVVEPAGSVSAGRLRIGPQGTLVVHADGSPDSTIDAGDEAVLDGTLLIEATGGLELRADAGEIVVLRAGAVQGRFAHVEVPAGLRVRYRPDGVVLEAVPPPSPIR